MTLRELLLSVDAKSESPDPRYLKQLVDEGVLEIEGEYKNNFLQFI